MLTKEQKKEAEEELVSLVKSEGPEADYSDLSDQLEGMLPPEQLEYAIANWDEILKKHGVL